MILFEMPECIQKDSKTPHFSVSTIFYQWSKTLQLQVVDGMGKQVFYKEIGKTEKEVTLDVSGWQSGMYYFQLVYGDTVVATEKVVVNQ
jgi:hypothetical protein